MKTSRRLIGNKNGSISSTLPNVQSIVYTSSLICRRKRKLRKRQPSDYKNHYPPYHSWIKKWHRAEGKRKNFNEEVIKTRGKRNIIKHRHVQISLKSFPHNSNASMCTCIIILTSQLTIEFTVWRYCYTCISRGKTFFLFFFTRVLSVYESWIFYANFSSFETLCCLPAWFLVGIVCACVSLTYKACCI